MNNRDEIVWHLVTIENDLARLAVYLEGESLRQKSTIMSLIREIEATAAGCRKRLVAADVKRLTNETEDAAVVTPKEVRELLEAFA